MLWLIAEMRWNSHLTPYSIVGYNEEENALDKNNNNWSPGNLIAAL